MLSIEALSKSFGTQRIFSDLTIHINERERVGLIGPNGSGKTTLLRIIAGEIAPDGGIVTRPRNTTVGYLPQSLISLRGATVMDEVMKGYPDILSIRSRLREIELRELHGQEEAIEYATLNNRYREHNGFALEQQAMAILRGMGFDDDDANRQTQTFSGGWQMRIVISRLLLSQPDILLLDEPTNHLDTQALDWLEDFLSSFKGIVIAVTHDRYFLKRFTRTICELRDGAIKQYAGTYEDFLFEKARIKETTRKRYFEQQRRIKEIKRFINRFKAKKDMRGRVQSRVKMLEKMERIELPKETRTIHFQFPQPLRSGLVVMNLSGVSKHYGKKRVLEGIDLTLERGDVMGIVGPNGIGKSTLLRILAGTEAICSGKRTMGHNVSIQFFSQDDVVLETKGTTVLEEAQRTAPELDISRLRGYLGAFLFTDSDVEKKIEVLSGGERSRLKLARMLLNPGNLLILDEPSNHLDIAGKEVLEEALRQFSGTIVIVSHDRYLLDRICNKIATISSHHLQLFWGDYSYYLKKREERVPDIEKRHAPVSGKSKDKERKRAEAEIRQHIYCMTQEIGELEKRIMDTEQLLETKEKLLLLPQTYQNSTRVKELMKTIETVRRGLEDLYVSFGEKHRRLDHLKEMLSP
jgi:ATP-binding cassette subfamily F protein 3